jgi:peptidase S41-like protein
MRTSLHGHTAAAALVAAVAATMVAATTTPAQTSPTARPPVVLDAATKRDVVDTMAAQLRRHYVDADTGRMIADYVLGRVAAGAYDSVTTPQRFTEVLTNDLHAVNGDRHLYVVYSPDGASGFRPGPEGIRMFAPPPGGAPRPGPSPAAIEQARRAHWTLGRVDILPGNVGYMDLRGFPGVNPDVENAIVSALRYLDGTDAIIFDLRRNGGGSPASVNLIISHFTTADTVASLTVRNRSGNETFTRYTLATVPGPRRPKLPLYVLTSGQTASAGEDFSFVLKNLGRAKLVGGRTAGAGHNNTTIDVGHGFGTSISFTRVMDPRSGKEWERVGVEPDIEVDQARALDVAHADVLARLAAGEPDPRRKRVLDLTREAVQAQATPRGVPPVMMARYVGEYDGGRKVWIEGGRLLYSPRPGVPPDPLVALTESTFAVGANRIAFEPDGQTVRLKVTTPDGVPLTYARVR